MLYGQWIAYSVVEEKSSRVMEVILGAATPFELLAGKVVGVGALAITQYVIVFVPAMIALLFQDQIAALVLGGTAAPIAAPAGLSIGLLLDVRRVLRARVRAVRVLYAGAASLVSRTEDINQIVAPMTLISMAGYLVAVYASTGLLDPSSTFVVVLSYIPFFSPYLMLTRMAAGLASPLEVSSRSRSSRSSSPRALDRRPLLRRRRPHVRPASQPPHDAPGPPRRSLAPRGSPDARRARGAVLAASAGAPLRRRAATLVVQYVHGRHARSRRHHGRRRRPSAPDSLTHRRRPEPLDAC